MKPPNSPAGRTLRLAIVDSLASCRIGLSDHLRGCGGLEVAWTSATAEEAYGKLSSELPDLLIVEIQLTGQDGLEFIKNLRPLYPGLKILVHSSMREEFYATRSIRAGARGFFHKAKPIGKLLPAIRRILEGGFYLSGSAMSGVISDLMPRTVSSAGVIPAGHLTDRELEVITLLAAGDSCKQTADKLSISPRTVQVHRTNIRQKLRLDSASRLHAYAVRFFGEPAVFSGACQSDAEGASAPDPGIIHPSKRRNPTERSSSFPGDVRRKRSIPKKQSRSPR